MSLWEAYLNERRGLRVWRTDRAFLTWKPTDDNGVYIQDIYTAPEARRQNVASSLTDEFVDWVKVNMPACDKLYGSVDLKANHPEAGLAAMIRYGFKILGPVDGGSGLFLRKDL